MREQVRSVIQPGQELASLRLRMRRGRLTIQGRGVYLEMIIRRPWIEDVERSLPRASVGKAAGSLERGGGEGGAEGGAQEVLLLAEAVGHRVRRVLSNGAGRPSLLLNERTEPSRLATRQKGMRRKGSKGSRGWTETGHLLACIRRRRHRRERGRRDVKWWPRVLSEPRWTPFRGEREGEGGLDRRWARADWVQVAVGVGESSKRRRCGESLRRQECTALQVVLEGVADLADVVHAVYLHIIERSSRSKS